MQTHQAPPPPAQLSGTVFIPPPERIPFILDHLDSAFSSLADVASVERTTVEALSAWLTQPEVQERQRNMDSAAATRSRSLATRNLHLAVAALSRMIQGHVIDDKVEPYSTNTKEVAARARLREVTRKACFLLMRIATFDPASPPPSRGRGQGGGSASPTIAKRTGSEHFHADLDLHELRALVATREGATARRDSGAAVTNSHATPRRETPSLTANHKPHVPHSSSPISNGQSPNRYHPPPDTS